MKKAVMGLVAAVTAGAAAADAAVIEMTVGEKSYAVELLENDAARDLMRRLPLEVTFENFGAVERIAYLKKALNLGSAPRETTPAAGDLTYYIPWETLRCLRGLSGTPRIWCRSENSLKKRLKRSERAGTRRCILR